MAKQILKYERGKYYAGRVKVEDIDLSVFAAIIEDEFIADGTSYQFTLSKMAFVPTIEVFVNGLKESKDEWGYGNGIITLSYAPIAGDVVTIRYMGYDA